MKVKPSYLALFMVILSCFAGIYTLPFSSYTVGIAAFAVTIFLIIKDGGIIEIKWNWISYIFAITVSSILGYACFEGFKYALFVLCIVVSGIVIKRYCEEQWFKMFSIISLIVTFSIIAQVIFPSAINSFNQIILPINLYSSMLSNYRFGSYAGLVADLPNAMFFSMSVYALGLIRILLRREKYNYVFIGVGLIGVFLSGKRSGLLILVLVSAFLYLLCAIKNKNFSLKLFISFIALAMGFFYVLYFTKIGAFYFEKSEALLSIGDFTNGRKDLNKQMIEIFKQKPIWGVGPLATKAYYGEVLGHNIYLQTLSECGVFGFISLICLLLMNLFKRIKELYKINDPQKETITYFSVFIQIFFIAYGFLGNPLFGPIFLVPYIVFSI